MRAAQTTAQSDFTGSGVMDGKTTKISRFRRQFYYTGGSHFMTLIMLFPAFFIVIPPIARA
jgi:hypothetical protein